MHFIKKKKPGIRVAVLTNGTLLSQKPVRDGLLNADLVIPSLDGATATAFQRINRPHSEINLGDYIEGLQAFRQVYRGKLALEIFILPGYNDDPADLSALKQAADRIRPDLVQLNTLDRPGVVDGLRAATRSELERIVEQWGWDHVEIIAPNEKPREAKSFRTDVESAIMETISRRPCTLGDLEQILGLHVHEINKYLRILSESGQIETRSEERGTFYQLPKSQ